MFGNWGNALRFFTLYVTDREKYKEALKKLGHPREYKVGISAKLKLQLLERDKHKCRLCGRSPAAHPRVKLTVDHIKPRSMGGKTIPSNLQTLCLQCNVRKGTNRI